MGWDESMFLHEKFCAASCRLVVFSAVGQKAWKKTQTSEKESSQKTGTHISANEVVGAPVMWPGGALLKPSYIPCPPHIRFSACSVWAYIENFRYCGKIKYARKTISPDCSLVKFVRERGRTLCYLNVFVTAPQYSSGLIGDSHVANPCGLLARWSSVWRYFKPV